MLFSYSAVAGIKGSKHDFSSPAGAGRSAFAGIYIVNSAPIEEICVFCHTPHHAASTAEPGMLWNRVNQDVGYSWLPYTSATLTSAVPTGGPTGISLMCMSCHDGVTSIGVGALLNAPGSGNPAVTLEPLKTDRIGDIYFSGSGLELNPNIADGWPRPDNTSWDLDMRNDHPISFEWPTGDPGLYNEPQAPNTAKLRLFGASKRRVECATCHSVHDNTIPPFLAVSNAGSGMCLSCHNK